MRDHCVLFGSTLTMIVSQDHRQKRQNQTLITLITFAV